MNRMKLFFGMARLSAGLVIAGVVADAPAQTVVFSTGFEAAEGYNTEANLSDQQDWVGTGADGILSNFFGDGDQQAYIGYSAPAGAPADFYYVYQPLKLDPVQTVGAVVKFAVTMQIVDSSSTNGPWDDFRWSAYNTNGQRLFSLDFDVASYAISYLLDDEAGFVPTGRQFDTLGLYELVISMNFGRNLWTASLNDEVVVHAKPITTTGSMLNLGDIDAVWSLRDSRAPGDNYMVFDDYRVTVEPAPSISARLEFAGLGLGGSYQARLYGEPGLVYRIEASSDLVEWQPLLTVTAPAGGVLDFQDSTAASFGRRFYRARQGPDRQ